MLMGRRLELLEEAEEVEGGRAEAEAEAAWEWGGDSGVSCGSGGMGNRPVASSINDRPSDHTSLCTVYFLPSSRSGYRIQKKKKKS